MKLTRDQEAELEKMRRWACCFEPERRFLADVECAALKQENERLRLWLQVVLDCVDYTAGNCRANEMVGAVLPAEIIEQAKNALLAKDGE